LLIGSAEGVAFLLRRHAAPVLAAHDRVVDGAIIAALLVFAVATMAGIRAQIAADVQAATICHAWRCILQRHSCRSTFCRALIESLTDREKTKVPL